MVPKKLSYWVVFVAAILIFSGCANQNDPLSRYRQERFQAPLSAPADRHHRYAVSAIVQDANGLAIDNFTIQPLSGEDQISAVINSLGSDEGVFHISRNPSFSDASSVILPFLISAPGFQSAIKYLEVGADCQTADCLGSTPLTLVLNALSGVQGANPTISQLQPKSIDQIMAMTSKLELFKGLIEEGKIDPALQQLLATSKNGDMLSNIVVMLNNSGSADPTALLLSLLGSTGNSNLSGIAGAASSAASMASMLASASPEVAMGMLAVNVLMPYMKNAMAKMAAKNNSPMAQILNKFVNDPNMQQGMSALINGLATGDTKQAASLAMGTFLPFMASVLKAKAESAGASPNPFASMLSAALSDPNMMNLITQGGKINSKDLMAAMMPHMQSLVQGLGGKNGPLLSNLLNSLVSGQDPLEALKNFPQSQGDLNQYAELIPYIEPLIQGLNGKDSQALSRFLAPILAQKDPSGALQSLILAQGSSNQNAALASALFPAMSTILSKYVPQKQILAAQMLQGLSTGVFKDVRVSNDLPAAPGVIVSGRAQDIFKIAQMPNVERILLLEE